MKILLIYNQYRHPGGENTYFYGLIKELRSHGHQVKTYVKESRAISKNPITQLIVLFFLFYNLVVRSELETIIKQFRPDIVQMHNLFPLIGYDAYQICVSFQIPFIQRINNYRMLWGKTDNENHDTAFGFHSFSYGTLCSFTLMRMRQFFEKSFLLPNAYIFPSQFIEKTHLKFLPALKKKTIVSSDFFIKETYFKKRVRSKYFLYSGRLSKEKGIIDLLNVLSELPSVKLVVIGDGPLAHEVANYKKFPNITIYKKMSFTKLQPFIAHALFTILPSRWYDVLPNVLIESFSQGTPVIVPRWGVFKEIVRERKTGLFYTYNSHNSLKKVILSALAHKSTSDLMLKHIKKEYITRYSKEVSYKRILSLYKSVISSKKL